MYGREVVLPSDQQLKAKLDPSLRDTDAAFRLENLQVSLRRTYKIMGANIKKSYETNKKYYDRKATVREFEYGAIVYLHNPMEMPQLSRKLSSTCHIYRTDKHQSQR
jgi:hypothetical protein